MTKTKKGEEFADQLRRVVNDPEIRKYFIVFNALVQAYSLKGELPNSINIMFDISKLLEIVENDNKKRQQG